MNTRYILGSLFLFALIALFLGGCRGDIKGSEAKKLVKEGALLLDVRTKAEFDQKHLPNALLIPIAELPKQLSKLPDKNRTIIVYCRSGARSSRAAKLLKKNGYKKTYNLGGIGNW